MGAGAFPLLLLAVYWLLVWKLEFPYLGNATAAVSVSWHVGSVPGYRWSRSTRAAWTPTWRTSFWTLWTKQPTLRPERKSSSRRSASTTWPMSWRRSMHLFVVSSVTVSFCLCLFYRLSLSVPSGSLSLSIVSVCLCWQFVSVCQLALSVPSVSLSLSVSAVSLSLSLLLVCLHLFWQFILSVCLFCQFVSVSSVSLPVSSASCLFCQFVSVHSPLCNHHV